MTSTVIRQSQRPASRLPRCMKSKTHLKAAHYLRCTCNLAQPQCASLYKRVHSAGSMHTTHLNSNDGSSSSSGASASSHSPLLPVEITSGAYCIKKLYIHTCQQPVCVAAGGCAQSSPAWMKSHALQPFISNVCRAAPRTVNQRRRHSPSSPLPGSSLIVRGLANAPSSAAASASPPTVACCCCCPSISSSVCGGCVCVCVQIVIGTQSGGCVSFSTAPCFLLHPSRRTHLRRGSYA